MHRIGFAALIAVIAAATPAASFAQAPSAMASSSAVTVNSGRMLYTANGQRVGAVYRVSAAGDPQVIMNGKLVTIPAATLSEMNGKLTTSLSRSELGRAK